MQRIEQFRNMVAADPENEMGHFSLGKAYAEAGMLDDAASSLARVLAINPKYSAAYQLLGQVQADRGRRSEAVEVLQRGYRIAHEKGELMPRNRMGDLLRSLGAAPPAVEEPARGGAADVPAGTSDQVQCRRCCRPAARLPSPPMRGDLGQKVYANICAACWREWIGMGTKIINELRLDFRQKQAQELFDQHMVEFLGLDGV